MATGRDVLSYNIYFVMVSEFDCFGLYEFVRLVNPKLPHRVGGARTIDVLVKILVLIHGLLGISTQHVYCPRKTLDNRSPPDFVRIWIAQDLRNRMVILDVMDISRRRLGWINRVGGRQTTRFEIGGSLTWDGEWEERVDRVEDVPFGKRAHQKFVDDCAVGNCGIGCDERVSPLCQSRG